MTPSDCGHRGGGVEYVFGYGSLLDRRAIDEAAGGDPLVCALTSYRRTWNVAMENARTIPGYKYYVDPATAARPEYFVTFLNIVPDPETSVNGVILEATRDVIERWDRRERNYQRIDVSADLSPAVDARVWAYAGSAAAVRRFRVGLRTRRAVISRGYYEGVLSDFASLGPGALQTFIDLTDPAPCPIVDLRRVDVRTAER